MQIAVVDNNDLLIWWRATCS